MGTSAKRGGARLRVEQNTSTAVALRVTGLSMLEIGKRIGVSQPRVSQLIAAYLTKLREMTVMDGHQLLTMELARLDQLLVGLWPARKLPKSATVILNVLERRHRLLGLDAPNRAQLEIAPVGILGSALDLSKLNDEELGWLEIILSKAGPQNDPTVVATQSQGQAI